MRRPALIGALALLTCGSALAQRPSEFAAADARLKACVARDGGNAHMMARMSSSSSRMRD